jgi:O-antigen/teichoic acid export membrane protein
MSFRRIAQGTALIGCINVVRLLVQFFSMPVLARLLAPGDYGLAAMAMPVIVLLMMLADAGLGNSLVRTGATDEIAWHTCFWLSVGLGSVVAIGVACIAPLVGLLLNEPLLAPVLMVLAAIVPLQTGSIVPGAALQKHARFGTIAAAEIAAMVASIGTALACAVAGLGVWALIGQQIVFYAVRLTLTLTLSPYRPRLVFALADAREHVIFGRNLLGVNLISSASRSLENLVIGKIYGPAPVGIYSMAFQFARLPFMLVTGPLQFALYPRIAALRADKTKLTPLFLLITRVLAMVVLPTVGLVAVASEPIFHLLLSKKWGQAAPLFLLIAPAASLQPVTAILGTFLMALGRTDVQMRLAAQFAAVWLVGLMLSVWYGIEAVAAVYSVCAVLFSVWSLRVCLPLLNCSFTMYARNLLWPLAMTASAILLYRLVSSSSPVHELLNVAIAAMLAMTASGLALLAQRRDLLAVRTRLDL